MQPVPPQFSRSLTPHCNHSDNGNWFLPVGKGRSRPTGSICGSVSRLGRGFCRHRGAPHRNRSVSKRRWKTRHNQGYRNILISCLHLRQVYGFVAATIIGSILTVKIRAWTLKSQDIVRCKTFFQNHFLKNQSFKFFFWVPGRGTLQRVCYTK